MTFSLAAQTSETLGTEAALEVQENRQLVSLSLRLL